MAGVGGTASAVATRLLVDDPTVVPDDLARAPARLQREPPARLAATHLRSRSPPGVSLVDERARAQAVVKKLFGPHAR